MLDYVLYCLILSHSSDIVLKKRGIKDERIAIVNYWNPCGHSYNYFFVFIIIKLNEMILEDEALELAHYCSMVKGGHWPDYRKIETASCDIITSESQTQSDKP